MCPLLGLLFLVFAAWPAFASDPDLPIDLDLRDADVRQVLMNIANKAKINLMLSPKVRGTITCRIKDMPARELIEFIVRTNGFQVEDHGRILLVLADDLPGRRTHVEVIPLQYADAAEVSKIITTLKLDKRARVTHDQRTNRLIVVWEY
jgi:protein transport protein HofQ